MARSPPNLDNTPLGVWRRLHAALMPDYNRKATAYWWTLVVLGLAALMVSAWQLVGLPVLALVQIAGGIALTMLMALYPLKIPRTNQRFSLGDMFIVLLLLTQGASAACIAAGLDTLVSSWRSTRRWTTRLGSATIAALSMFACGHAMQPLLRGLALGSADYAALLVLVTMTFGLVYCAVTALLMSGVARLKRNERLQLSDMVSVFGWVGGASAGASAIAALLFITVTLAGLGVMLTIVPTLGLLLMTMHFFSRQQEADEAVRQAAAQTLEREAELAISQARQREAEQAAQHLRDLETSERRFNSAFTHASIGMALLSLDGNIHLANPALQALLGCAETGLADRLFADFVAPLDRPRLAGTLARMAKGTADTVPVELCCHRPNGGKDGDEVWVSIGCSLFTAPDAAGPSLIMQVQDITARRSAEIELQHRAYHDKLTGLPNRDRFHQALGAAIERADGGPGRAFAVLFLDFDRFKLINDSKGHTVGDEFLVAASRRLAQCLRKGDMLARLGGDEFAILAGGLSNDGDAVDMAERLLDAMKEPLQLSAMEITATASVGITFSSLGYSRPEDMLRDADIAMYRAKVDGKARYALFDVKLHTEVANRVRLEADLRQALADHTLTLAYQPLYDLNSGQLLGFEALARWVHPELGPVSPATFIPIAEESGLITQLTAFVLQAACGHLRQWMSDHPGCDDLSVHVNIAARDLADSQFVSRVQHALSSSGLAPQHLVIELTENILMAQLAAAMTTLRALRDLGVGLSVDDFGTGYSSLSHLAVLPIDSLKIDMSFVRPLRAGSKEAAVIRAIVLLGKSLDKQVIAEGIETALQKDLLRELGCDVGQGYHLSRPLALDAVGQLLRDLPPRAGQGSGAQPGALPERLALADRQRSPEDRSAALVH